VGRLDPTSLGRPPSLVSWGRGKVHPFSLYKGGPRREEDTQQLATCLLSSFHVALPSSPPLPLPLVWPPKGLRRRETTPSLHAVMLRSFWIPSKAIYFRNVGYIGDSGGHRDHHTCVSTRGAACCGTRVVAPSSSTTLKPAMSAS
jgi:hypothetical protein